MALVPFRVSGPAASQQLDSQLLQVGPYSLMLHQRPQASGNAAHLMKSRAQQQQQQGEDVEQDRPQQQVWNTQLFICCVASLCSSCLVAGCTVCWSQQ